MRQRIISAVFGLALVALIIFQYDTFVLNLTLSIVSVIGLGELIHGESFNNKLVNAISFVYVALVPLSQYFQKYDVILNYGFAMILPFILMLNLKKILLHEIAILYLFATIIAHSMTVFVRFRDDYGMAAGLYYCFITLGASWGADTGAYFSGRMFGKRKLAPEISPNKTVEGAIGGGIIGIIIVLIISVCYNYYCAVFNIDIKINYLPALLVSPFLVAAGMCGDLIASAIKRQLKIKDFGQIIPGHGGVLDRFDSVIAVAPLLYMIVRYIFPIAEITL